MSSDPSSATATTLGATEGAMQAWPRPGFSPGESIGRYLVLDRIGAGGMGVVYSAYDPKLERKIAIKVLHGSARAGDTRGQQRLAREAQALARLNHPAVVTVNDVGLHEGRVFVAMDFIEGRTLGAWLDARPPWRDVVRVMLQAGRGLAAAHENGLVHRDFKPDNVMIGADGRVVVMDFGLAHPIAAEADESGSVSGADEAVPGGPTRRGALVGTVLYMAPEQFAGAEVGPATDVFAFCVVLWEALYGERPFSGTTAAELARHVGEGLVRAPPPGSDVPAALRRVALRGLCVAPADRWPSMHELLRVLARDPVARRRRVAWLAGLAIAAAAVPFSWSAYASRAIAACHERVGTIDDAWNVERAATIEHAMQASGVSYAADVWARARIGLDGTKAAWLDRRERLCEREPGLASPRAEATHACLDHARTSVAALTELLSTTDAELVPHVTRMVAALPPVHRCDDARALPPIEGTGEGDPLVRVRVARERLAWIGTRFAAGRSEEARAAAERLRDEALASGDRWLQAESEHMIARALDKLGRYEDAHARHQVAYDLAHELEDPLAVRAAAGLVWTAGMRLDRHDEAMHWYRTALALAERLDLGDEPELAELYNAVGSVFEARGEYDEALAAHEKTLAIRIAVYGPQDATVAMSLNNIATVHQSRGDYDAALATMQRAAEIVRRADGPMHPDVAMILGNLGNLHFTRGDASKALELQQQALAIEEVVLGPEHPRLARTILNVGVLQLGREDFDLALTTFQRALAMQERTLGLDHLDVAATMNNIGNVHFHRKEYDQALAAYERALSIRTQVLGPVHQRVGTLHDNIGQVHEARGDLDPAQAAYAQAVEVLERAVGGEHPLLGLALEHLGTVQLKRGEAEPAVRTLERTLEVLELGKDDGALAGVRFALARALVAAKGDTGRARSLAELAHRHYEDAREREHARALRRWLEQLERQGTY